MPSILTKNGFRFFFFTNEPRFKPAHIHVQYGKGSAIFWLNPVELTKNKGLSASELAKARKIVLEYKKLFEERYHEHFGSKSN